MTGTEQGAGYVRIGMSMEDLLKLTASVPLPLAAQAMGIGRTLAYSLAKRGEFPITCHKVASRYMCPRAALFRYLEVPEPLLAMAS
jgi:hypothetical protein